ncbi:tetratricopeptide repeat protein [Desulfosudis oleivorans]|uniref:Tetratricopeptide TPR_2 repeat protein n=1 Tax=Desulfosudis oleivorans (strain DSM 6200 / JCM 39069 / Hxd3) TaxID=96561 RepID=A8ZYD3_DESOH|nr:tetratricopeptide repeat protein [Desulfosudis oleivorans]ABW68658.1 Tetratricopeptide TPR_2 repeat protein [Desulfosudis oleivorans Hxd3]
MAKISRISLERKRELEEPDKFMVFVARAMQLAQTYRKQITAIIGLVIAVAVVTGGVFYLGARAEVKASDMLASATARADAAGAGSTDEYRAVYETYPRTVAGQIAGLRYAEQLYRSGEAAAAVDVYTKLVKSVAGKPTLHHLALNGLGYAHEAAGDLKAAADCFETIAATPVSAHKETALFNLARLYEQVGETEKSQKAFAQIVSEYPDSMYADIAREKSAS